jgi:hypothetical protein
MSRIGFFRTGNHYGQGRPPKSKNQIETIRRRILMVVRKRIMREKDLESVTTTDLLKFLAVIMPKDVGISVQAPQVNYISNVPREEVIEQIKEQELLPVSEPVNEGATNELVQSTMESLETNGDCQSL